MSSNPLDRRQFNHLIGAAFGGLVAGATVGCKDDKGSGAGDPTASASAGGAVAAAGNVHACRGLNECKGQGADGKNACAGQGTCATSKHHGCATMNECRNLGGCGGEAAGNACKGQGGCAVPITHAWDAARKNFEKRMNAEKKTFGDAPPAKAS